MNQAWKSFRKNLLLREVVIIIWIILLWWIIFRKVEWFSFVDSLYFTVITITTIWYWDITPQTDLWKIFAMIYAFMWVPIFVSLSWLILESRFNRHIKYYMTHFHKELHKAEEELKEVEEKVESELWDVIKQWEKTETKIDETAKWVKVNKRKIEKIEEIIKEEITEKKPRRKIWKRK